MATTMALTDQFSPCQYRAKQRGRKGSASNSSSVSFLNSPLTHCDQLSFGVVLDIVILIVVLGACGFLFTPYFTFIAAEAAEVVPAALVLIGEVVIQAPLAYAGATVFMFVAVLVGYEIYEYMNRKCDNPNCRGLRNAVELDIQLETEECVKTSSSLVSGGREVLPWNGGVRAGHEQKELEVELRRLTPPKELEAELRRMAPRNGRAVLIFRAPCGCPAARFEASGSKKARRSKK